MKWETFFFFLVFAFSSYGEVIELTTQNFTNTVAKGTWLVEFYAPWCGFCKNFAPEYEKLAEKLEGQIKVAKVNVDEEKMLGARYDIRSLPTIKYFHELTEEVQYEGSRDVDDLIKFVELRKRESATPPPTVELTEENIFTLVKPEETWLLKFYADWCSYSKQLSPVWVKLAKELHPLGIRIGNVNISGDEATLLSQLFQITPYGVEHPIPTIMVSKGGLLYILEKERTHTEIRSFALGGYKNSPMELFPMHPQSPFFDQAKAAIPLLEAYVQRYPLEVFGGVFLYGLFIGYLIADKKNVNVPRKMEIVNEKKNPKATAKKTQKDKKNE